MCTNRDKAISFGRDGGDVCRFVFCLLASDVVADESLPQDIFLQIHRSYISNINQVNAHPIFIGDRLNSKG